MSNAVDRSITCPVCRVRVPAGVTTCPDCGQELAAMVQAARKADVLFNEALDQAKVGRWVGAQTRLLQALEADPNHVQAQHLLARIYARNGQSSEARAAWQNVLTLAPEHAGAMAGLAWLDEADKQADANAISKAVLIAKARTAQRWKLVGGVGAAFVAGVALMALLLRPSPNVAPAIAEVPATVIVERLIVATPTAAPTALATSAPTAVQTAMPPGPTATPVQPTPIPPTPIPPDLIAVVKQRMSELPELNGLNIAVEQAGNDIVLSGNVPSLLTKYLAEKASADAAGVTRVISQLQLTDVHIVQRGENLWDIASAVYGSPRYWRTIAIANRLRSPFRVFAGQRLILPER